MRNNVSSAKFQYKLLYVSVNFMMSRLPSDEANGVQTALH